MITSTRNNRSNSRRRGAAFGSDVWAIMLSISPSDNEEKQSLQLYSLQNFPPHLLIFISSALLLIHL
jgi:hypothetical protein